MIKNYYSILNINRNAKKDEIRKAYRALALKYHPDINNSEEATLKFIEATEAYEVLIDDSKRIEYDNLYDKIHCNDKNEDNLDNIKTARNYWRKYGEEKANMYASIPITELSRKLLSEIKIGASYIPNIMAIVFVLFMAFSALTVIPDLKYDETSGAIFLIIIFLSLTYLAYRLFNVAKNDYKKERKIKL